MLVAVLSDIHANLEALQAVLDDMESHGAEGILGLGDYIGFNGNPSECLSLRCRGIMRLRWWIARCLVCPCIWK